MPMSSMEIAQTNGAYQQQALQQMQYAGAIGQQLPFFGGERMMGAGMTAAGAMAPLGMAGLAIKGWDPFSVAIRTSWPTPS